MEVSCFPWFTHVRKHSETPPYDFRISCKDSAELHSLESPTCSLPPCHVVTTVRRSRPPLLRCLRPAVQRSLIHRISDSRSLIGEEPTATAASTACPSSPEADRLRFDHRSIISSWNVALTPARF